MGLILLLLLVLGIGTEGLRVERAEGLRALGTEGLDSGSWRILGCAEIEGSGVLRLRGGVSKYYNHTAEPNRGGIFEEPKTGVAPDEGQSPWNKGGWSFEERDFTEWTKRKLGDLLEELSLSTPPFYFSNVLLILNPKTYSLSLTQEPTPPNA